MSSHRRVEISAMEAAALEAEKAAREWREAEAEREQAREAPAAAAATPRSAVSTASSAESPARQASGLARRLRVFLPLSRHLSVFHLAARRGRSPFKSRLLQNRRGEVCV
jgi:hypothetical protein